MAKSGLTHIDVGPELTRTEWESEESHALINGAAFPASPVERQLFYRNDLHAWYIYNGSAWVSLQGAGAGGGDMLKSVYDTNDNGIVDNSEKLEASTKAQVQDHTPKAHTLASHSTKAHSELTGVGTDDHHAQVHGNAAHSPHFAADADLDAHVADEAAAVHGSTALATANKLMHRDAAGRAKVVAPAASDDIAQKAQPDAVQTNLNSHAALTTAHGATPAATPSRIVVRDASARAKFAAPAAAGDALIKGTAITDTEHGSRGSGLHADSHPKQHAITSTPDHTSGATPGRILKADANGLPVDAANTDTDVADAVTKKHAQNTDTDLSPAHKDVATGVHGVGGSTVESASGSQAKVDTHKAAKLSSTVHPNTAMCSAYLAAHQSYIPTAKYARVQLDTATFDPGSNFKNGYVFNQEQADAANCTATNIRDTSVNFQTITGQTHGLRYALVTWSSDAGGTLNLGSGYVTAVPDTTNLTIYKTNGADFANSYYYTIKEAWYKVPVTGYYTLPFYVRFSSTNMVADKSYYIMVLVNGTAQAQACLHSSRTAALQPFAAAILSLTANDLLSIGVYHDSGADTIQLEEWPNRTALHIALLQEA